MKVVSTRKLTTRMLLSAGAMTGLVAVAACGSGASAGTQQGMGQSSSAQSHAAGMNPDLDTGTSLGGVAAPEISLVNQFGQPMSLSQFRGKVVVLAFVDSQCTTVCPLTTVSMTQARELLGTAGSQVQLLGVDANPQATSVSDVMAYSQAHSMVNQWDFMTGSASQLQAVWKAYHIYVAISAGQIDHTPALFVIDQRGREQEIYLTSMAYASVSQEAQVLAQKISTLLPSHPKLARQSSLSYIDGIPPTSRVTLNTTSAGSVTLGPGQARMMVFFATWLSETSNLSVELTGLDGYAQAARHSGLPPLVAVDEAVTEPSSGSASRFLQHLAQPLSYPVALDTTGRIADGYGVQDQPWFVLTNSAGKVVWSHDGWLPVSALESAASKA